MSVERPDLDEALRALADDERAHRGDDHPDPEALLAYHLRELPEAEADRIQEHLALCPECAGLVLDFATFPALEPPEGTPRLGRRDVEERWRALRTAVDERRDAAYLRPKVLLPLAAVFLVAAVGLGTWSIVLHQRLDQATRPRGDVPVVGLRPADEVTRGAPSKTVPVSSATERVLVSLAVGELREFPRYEVDLVTATGQRPIRGLRVERAPPPQENFSIEVPERLLAPGEYRVELYGVRNGSRELLARYPFQVTRPGR